MRRTEEEKRRQHELDTQRAACRRRAKWMRIAALGIPAVGLFGPTDPARTGPFSDRAIALRHPQSRTTFSHHHRPDEGLLQISAEEVIGAARHLLGGGRA